MNMNQQIENIKKKALNFFPEIPNSKEPEAEVRGSLLFYKRNFPSKLEATLYEPVVCLILQGAKETIVGNRSNHIGVGDFIIVSHDLPVTSRITDASPEAPYIALIFNLNIEILRSLYDQLGNQIDQTSTAQSLTVGSADQKLLDVISRYISIVDHPLEKKVLEPLLLKEIHFRLLVSTNGAMLHRLLRFDSNASKIRDAIKIVREKYKEPLNIPNLASKVAMSSSSFHNHFKNITETTPLQYQKQLRLLEARRILQIGSTSVTEVSYEVGYESPTQFSREYRAKFGLSPSEDYKAVIS